MKALPILLATTALLFTSGAQAAGEPAVESRRGAVAWAIRHRPVSPPRSSNRTSGFPASGSPTGFTARHTVDGQCRLVSRDDTVARHQPSPCGRALSEAFRSRLVLPGSSPITDPQPLRKRARSQGPFLRRHYPASRVVWPCPTSARPAALATASEARPPAGTGLCESRKIMRLSEGGSDAVHGLPGTR